MLHHRLRVALPVTLGLLSATLTARAKLVIDEVDVSTRGRIVVVVDLLDAAGLAVPGKVASDFRLTYGGLDLGQARVAETFAASGRALAVALLVPAHAAYAGEGGALVQANQGFVALMKALAPQDRVAVFRYDESGMARLRPWAAPSPLDPVTPAPDARAELPPPLYRTLSKVVDAFAEASADLPARRAIVTVSDGQDAFSEAVRAKARARIVETALAPDTGVALHVLGFASPKGGDPAAMAALGSLAQETGGTYREIGAGDQANIVSGLEAFAVGLKRSYVLTFDAKDVRCTGSGAVRIEVGAERQELAGEPGAVCQRVPPEGTATTGETAAPSSKSGCASAPAGAMGLLALMVLAWRRRA